MPDVWLPPLSASLEPARVPVSDVNNPGCLSPLDSQRLVPELHFMPVAHASASAVNSSGETQLRSMAPVNQAGVTVTHTPRGLPQNSTGEMQRLDLSRPVEVQGPPLARNVMADNQNFAKHTVDTAIALPRTVNVNAGLRRADRSGSAPTDVIIK